MKKSGLIIIVVFLLAILAMNATFTSGIVPGNCSL